MGEHTQKRPVVFLWVSQDTEDTRTSELRTVVPDTYPNKYQGKMGGTHTSHVLE